MVSMLAIFLMIILFCAAAVGARVAASMSVINFISR